MLDDDRFINSVTCSEEGKFYLFKLSDHRKKILDLTNTDNIRCIVMDGGMGYTIERFRGRATSFCFTETINTVIAESEFGYGNNKYFFKEEKELRRLIKNDNPFSLYAGYFMYTAESKRFNQHCKDYGIPFVL